MKKVVLTLVAALLAAPICWGQAAGPPSAGQPVQDRAPVGGQAAPYCERCAAYCSPSRVSTLTAGRPVAMPQASSAQTPSADATTLGKIVSILEAHDRRLGMHDQQLADVQSWRRDVDSKLNYLLEKNGYAPPAGNPLALPQPLLMQRQSLPGYSTPPAYIDGRGRLHYVDNRGVAIYDNDPPIDYYRLHAQGSAVYGSPVYASSKYLDYGRPLDRTPPR